jgi:predicted ester cyclase
VFRGFPDITFVVGSRIVDGDRAAFAWTASGTHLSDLGGLPATGRGGTVRGTSMMELRDGRLGRCTDCGNPVELLRQPGVMD